MLTYNIFILSQVVEVAKRFLSQLDKVAFETDENLCVGPVFIENAAELCDVYKTYCSNHNVAVEPLMKKVSEDKLLLLTKTVVLC